MFKEETLEERLNRHLGGGGWIGVDLDGTFAYYDRWRGNTHIGKPIPAMLARIKRYLKLGHEVRIVTARASGKGAASSIDAIETYCEKHLGQKLKVTCQKDFGMIVLFDDRAIQVVPNTGQTLADAHAAEIAALRGAP